MNIFAGFGFAAMAWELAQRRQPCPCAHAPDHRDGIKCAASIKYYAILDTATRALESLAEIREAIGPRCVVVRL